MAEKEYFLRNEIGSYMTTLGKKSDKVVVVNADLAGTCRNTHFEEAFPGRSFNTGIAEQNMVSFATGLAHEGFIPYAFSMAPFLSMRACEQCRTDVAYGKSNVRLIAVYSGVSGGISGATHWAIEDCGIMTSIPGITVIEPSDPVQIQRMLDYSLEYAGPMYFRCSIEPVKALYDSSFDFRVGGSAEIVSGEDGAILCSGAIVQYAVEAARRLREKNGLSIRVVDMYSIKPVDESAIISAAKSGNVVVAQDHNVFGGLGSIVAMVMMKHGLSLKFDIAGIDDEFIPMAHSSFIYHRYQLDSFGLEQRVLHMLGME